MSESEDQATAAGSERSRTDLSGQSTAVTSQLDVRGIPCFNPREDPTNLAVRWRRWKRSFNLYLLARGVANDQQKVALLLHTAGPELQELYFTLVGEEEKKSFEDCVKFLDEYFIPKVNLPFERHQFRQMTQSVGERVDQFVSRLRNKASTCEFADVDEAIRDQLIEKCNDPKLQRRFLGKTNATLKDLKDIARAYEAVDEQMKALEPCAANTDSVNSVNRNTLQKGRGRGKNNRKPETQKKPGHYNRPGKNCKRCFNCNRIGHFARDTVCPAKTQKCRGCGAQGHYEVCCPDKRQSGTESRDKSAYQVVEKDNNDNVYVFGVRAEQETTGEVVLNIGGVIIGGFLIDSGATCNIVDYNTWNYLKEKRVKCESRRSEKKLFAYGQKDPMDVVGIFVADIVCEESGERCTAEFTVIKGTGRPLLGRKTAEMLSVLRVSPTQESRVHSVSGQNSDILGQYPDLFSGEVGKLKDFQQKLHINRDVKPVAQPVRRLPFGLTGNTRTLL